MLGGGADSAVATGVGVVIGKTGVIIGAGGVRVRADQTSPTTLAVASTTMIGHRAGERDQSGPKSSAGSATAPRRGPRASA